jgi:hypothetical protein
MGTLITLAIILAVIFLIITIGATGKKSNKRQLNPKDAATDKKQPKYKSKLIILSPTEQTFYKALKKSLDPNTGITIKPRLSDILQPVDKGKEYYGAFQRITSKHVDFVLYDSTTFQIQAAIELDDSSHQQPKRIERDAFVNQAFEDAEIPLHRFKAQKQYDQEIIIQTTQHPQPDLIHSKSHIPSDRKNVAN